MSSDIIDLRKKMISIGRHKLKLIMAYPCPFCDSPLIAYWQIKDGGPGVQDIRSALDDSGFEGYRVFETEGGQGFEYDLEKDPKKRHEHHEGGEWNYIVWKPYLSLNPAFSLIYLIADTTGTEVGQVEMYPVPEALGLIENMRGEEPYFRVVDDIIGHGKPLFFFNWSKWSDQWQYGYADRDSKMEQMLKLLGQKRPNVGTDMEGETKRLLEELADLGVNKNTTGVERGVVEGETGHGSPIGSWHLMWDFRDGVKDVYIHDLDVAMKFEGKGYGRRIYQTVEAAWKRLGVKRVTGEARPGVHGFWKKMGFSIGKQTYEGGAFEDPYFLIEKKLSRANPTLAIPYTSKEQMVHLHRAEAELRKAGVTFDIGTTIPPRRRPGGLPSERHWELDWSLEGATLENPRITFAKCFPRSKIKLIEHYVGPALAAIEELAGRKIDFPSTVRCMTKKEIAEGRKIRDLGHEGGAGHGLLIWEGGEYVVKVNKNMSPGNILANVIHENLHIAFPDKHEVVIDDLTDSIMGGVRVIQANPKPIIRAYKDNPLDVGGIIMSVIIKQLITQMMG